ncbi:MAG: nucleotidyltransferase family protein [Sphingobium sp.]|uniref:nucleotidyltransferase family protein n=1 Tax=Sphingobium sp. TaxID=1912891 RepID=UPI0029B8AAAB|nr:nucleotidyltransferase family protein [Sphingobium sp.]MDX3911282.1 nucleotidyltransferase family protein [Sphingobium sp.]
MREILYRCVQGRQHMAKAKTLTIRSRRERPSVLFDRHRSEIRAIVERHKGSNPRVFGSVARGDDKPGSDLDLLVDHKPGNIMSLFDLSAINCEIEDLLGLPVQVLTPASLAPNIRVVAEREARTV